MAESCLCTLASSHSTSVFVVDSSKCLPGLSNPSIQLAAFGPSSKWPSMQRTSGLRGCRPVNVHRQDIGKLYTRLALNGPSYASLPCSAHGNAASSSGGVEDVKVVPAPTQETGLALFTGGRGGQLQVLPLLQGTRTEGAAGNSKDASQLALQTISKEEAWGLAIRAVTGGSTTGWVTGSGLAGPSMVPLTDPSRQGKEQGTPLISKSPRRRMAVEFTCNKCGTRTTRAINPHAYKEGTVFVQCKGCEVFHKLVDNLGLFHELKGPVFGPAYRTPDLMYHEPYDPFASLD